MRTPFLRLVSWVSAPVVRSLSHTLLVLPSATAGADANTTKRPSADTEGLVATAGEISETDAVVSTTRAEAVSGMTNAATVATASAATAPPRPQARAVCRTVFTCLCALLRLCPCDVPVGHRWKAN